MEETDEVVDYSEHFPNALLAQGKGSNVLILERLNEPFKRFDGKMALYRLQHRWLSRMCENPEDEAYVCVQGSENTYWRPSEIPKLLSAIQAGDANLFDHFSMF